MQEGIYAHFKTEKGNIKVQLTFDRTPGTVGNFVGLVEGAIENKVSPKGTPYYDGLKFHRVIADFMIQGGNSDDRITLKKRKTIGKYLLPNDYDKGFKHDRGMLSMPSKNIENPYKKASPFEFFIVQQKGGAHHLDGDYTIFGKVVKGMDVVDKISAVPTDASDWPLQNVFIKDISIIKQ